MSPGGARAEWEGSGHCDRFGVALRSKGVGLRSEGTGCVYLQVLGVLEEVAGNHSPGGHGGFGRALPRREGAPKDHLVLASTTASTICQRELAGWAAAHGRGDG